jgi:hypothetical protein
MCSAASVSSYVNYDFAYYNKKLGKIFNWWSTKNKSEFAGLMKAEAPHISVIHQYALPPKRCPQLEGHCFCCRAVQVVKFIQTLDINRHLFKVLSQEVWLEHDVFLYHTEVYWLTRSVLSRLTELEPKLYSGCDLFCGNFSHLNDMNRAILESGMTVTVRLILLFNDTVSMRIIQRRW